MLGTDAFHLLPLIRFYLIQTDQQREQDQKNLKKKIFLLKNTPENPAERLRLEFTAQSLPQLLAINTSSFQAKKTTKPRKT